MGVGHLNSKYSCQSSSDQSLGLSSLYIFAIVVSPRFNDPIHCQYLSVGIWPIVDYPMRPLHFRERESLRVKLDEKYVSKPDVHLTLLRLISHTSNPMQLHRLFPSRVEIALVLIPPLLARSAENASRIDRTHRCQLFEPFQYPLSSNFRN